METLLLAILACYGITKIVTESYAAKGFRNIYRDVLWEVAPRRLAKHCVKWFTGEEGEEQVILTDEQDTAMDGREIKGFSMIECALCMGFWFSIPISLASGLGWWFLAIYGGATFLTTQER